MFDILVDRTYRHLFAAQVVALLGTGLATVALGPLACDLAGHHAALVLSRLAYELENILSPTLAALLLAVLSYDALFLGTALGFAASGGLVLSVLLPRPEPGSRRGFYDSTTRGIRIYLATPRLRGLLALNVAASAGGAMVLVNTVVLVRGGLGLSESAVAVAMGASGLGSMIAALVLPRLLDRLADRRVMSGGAALMVAELLGLAPAIGTAGLNWSALLLAWLVFGFGYSSVLTPTGRLLRRSSNPEDWPAVFAAQFALSHARWLVCYPLAGALMTLLGATAALVVLAGLALAGLALARRAWPARDPQVLPHRHENLPPSHPHLREGRPHAHPFVIDDLHRTWPEAQR
ncbi:MFS transporter [Rhodovulum marinum]|uniref:Putative MFS family arabinose efflux permease n=1 Tax=Rhodovulum marinum TaxID=320662 RepID=A0A4R2PV72_9RHOB|nr:MFS transporter [Rhodovulum marinum]TCP38101.1 putative MFS family arabinose efflux permease [Rhodovulum marinum]